MPILACIFKPHPDCSWSDARRRVEWLALARGRMDTAGMIGTLVGLIAGGVIALLWLESRAAQETARAGCVRACSRSGVQLLDQSVALKRLRLRRHDSGRIGLLRRYAFEFSTNGADRHPGTIELHGARVLWVSLPLPEA